MKRSEMLLLIISQLRIDRFDEAVDDRTLSEIILNYIEMAGMLPPCSTGTVGHLRKGVLDGHCTDAVESCNPRWESEDET